MGGFRRFLTFALVALALPGWMAAPTSAASSRGAERVEGSYIVSVSVGGKLSASRARAIAADHGGRAVHVYPRLRAFAFEGGDGAESSLRRDGRVTDVEADRLVHATSDPIPDLKHLTRTDSYQAHQSAYTGQGVTIAVVDTGVEAGHSVFDHGQVVAGKACVKGGTDDREGHGTATAGNAAGRAGVAHLATIVPVRVFPNNSLSTTISKVVCGLNWVEEQNDLVPGAIDVVNLSLAFSGGSKALKRAVGRVVASGATVVAAAGNNGGALQAPARYAGVISVSALGGGTKLASFSAKGADMTAPGVKVYSPENGAGDGFSYRSGTSRAAPIVAGVAAIILAANPTADVLAILRTSGRCPNGETNGGPGFCPGRWQRDDRNAEPLANAYCAGIWADPLSTDPDCGD